jgi:2'-5' RNA ligase
MEPLHRLFFALKPPVPEARRIGLLRDGVGQGTIVADDRLHMTMGITDDFPCLADRDIDRMMAIGDTIAGDPVPLSLDRLSGSARSVALRPSTRPAALGPIQKQIQRLLDYWGMARTGWEFSPHVTLLYRAGQPFQRQVTARGWQADELVLIHSLIGETRHVPLGRWPILPKQGRLFG